MSFDDEFLRSTLNEASPRDSADALNVLATLKPSMRRARIRRHVGAGAMAMALFGTGTAGVLALNVSSHSPTVRTASDEGLDDPTGPTRSDPNHSSDEATAPSVAEPRQAEEGIPADTSARPVTEGSVPTVPGRPSTVAPPTIPPVNVAPSTNPPSSDHPNDTSVPRPTIATQPTNPPVPSTNPPVPSTNSPVPSTNPPVPSTSPPVQTTTTTIAREVRIASMCGTVVVYVGGSKVDLVRTEPLAGFQVDVKNDGPGEVEVGFADGVDECEVHARVVAGDLVINVHDNPGDHERSD